MSYPEHEKQAAVKDAAQAIGEFLDFSGYMLCEMRTFIEPSLCGRPGLTYETEPRLAPVGRSIQAVLAAYFEIDLDKLEAEKRAMIDELRRMNDAAQVAQIDRDNANALEHLAEFNGRADEARP